MTNNYLITGYWGEPHVTAENDRGFNAAVFGAGRFVLPVGEMFRSEYIGNNTVRVYDGKLIDGGALAGIPAGKYIDFLIPEAGQGMNRNDLIVFEYAQDSSTKIETGVFKVVSGIETSGTAVDPVLHEEDILSDEATLDQMALFRVCVSGAVISAPEIVFETKYAGERIVDMEHGGTNASSLSGARKNLGIVTTVRNLLDNSDFSDPVAQAGLNGMHGTKAYAIDRWLAHNLTVAQQSDCLKATPTATYAYILQRVEVTPGKKYTCAAKFSGAGVGEIRVYNYDMNTQYAKKGNISTVGLVTFTVPEGIDIISVVLYPNAANVASGLVYWAALYEGEYTADNLPKYQPKGYAAELAECQRYCYVIRSGYTYVHFATVSLSNYENGSSALISLPVEMRICPTVVWPSGLYIAYKGDISTAITGITNVHDVTERLLRVKLNHAANSKFDNYCLGQVMSTSATNLKIVLSADL